MSQNDTNADASSPTARVSQAPPPNPLPRDARTSPETLPAATKRPTLGLVLFGRDAAGKRRAACFPPEKAAEAERAAALMGLQVFHLTDPEQMRRAATLPHGRLFASGRALVPYVKNKVLDAVFEAKAPPVAADPDDPGEPSIEAFDDPQFDLNRPAPTQSEIVVGSLVLVGEVYPLCGWYEAIVVAAPGDDLFTLRWRDWPDDPLVARRRDDLALLPPNTLAASGVTLDAGAGGEH